MNGASLPGRLPLSPLPSDRPVAIAVLRSQTTSRARAIADALLGGGLRMIEVTYTVPGATELIGELADDDRCVPGAGTVLHPAQVVDAAQAGARFVVSPGLDEAVIEAALAAGVPVLPGVMTPSEAMRARAQGVESMKLFPADTVGVGHLRAMRAVFPDIQFVPTGGIGPGEAGAWLSAGAAAVGIGGAIETTYDRRGKDGLHVLAGTLVQLCNQVSNVATTQEANDR